MWSDPFWGKPFGAQSEERERAALVRHVEAEQRANFANTLLPIKTNCPVYRRHQFHMALPVVLYKTRRQVAVRVRKYAHERIVVRTFLKPAGLKPNEKLQAANKKWRAAIEALDIPRETRRAIKIGSRFRKLPMATKWTTNGRNWIRDAAHMVEISSSGIGIFLTLTLPGGTEDAFHVMSIASGYVVDRLNRWLRYRVDHGIFCYVWELQRRGAPHLHYLLRLPDGCNKALFIREIKKRWYQILLDVCEDSQVDLFERKKGGSWILKPWAVQVDCRLVERTYSKYISKYVSKTHSKAGKKHKWCPGRWWGVSKRARALVLANRFEETINCMDFEISLNGVRYLTKRATFLTEDVYSYASMPKAEHDSVSLQVVPGYGTDLAMAFCEYFSDGNLGDLVQLLERAARLDGERINETRNKAAQWREKQSTIRKNKNLMQRSA